MVLGYWDADPFESYTRVRHDSRRNSENRIIIIKETILIVTKDTVFIIAILI